MVRDAASRLLSMRVTERKRDKFNTTANHFWFSETMSSPGIKNISLHNYGNQNYNSRHPGPQEGRFAIVTMRWAGAAMDALASGVSFAPDENAKAYGEV